MPKRRQLIRKVRLKFFQNDDSDIWGVSHADTIEDNEDNTAFDPFWDGEGLFHDVFEHAHEGSEFFRGEYKQNVGGEMAAMGFLFYFCEDLGVNRFPRRGFWSTHTDVAINTTWGYVQEGMEYGYARGGNQLRSNVPRQEAEEYFTEDLDYLVELYWKKVKASTRRPEDRAERIYANAYRRSVTKRKILDLHRWGYYEARRLFPRNHENAGTLTEFIRFWNTFCKENKAEEMAEVFSGIDFYLYRTGDFVTWMSTLVAHDHRRVTVHPDMPKFYLDSYRDLVLESAA